MTRLYSRFWLVVTLVLSVIFIVLFYPIVQDRYGFTGSILLTAGGLLVIWVVYVARAYIFTSFEKKGPEQ